MRDEDEGRLDDQIEGAFAFLRLMLYIGIGAIFMGALAVGVVRFVLAVWVVSTHALWGAEAPLPVSLMPFDEANKWIDSVSFAAGFVSIFIFSDIQRYRENKRMHAIWRSVYQRKKLVRTVKSKKRVRLTQGKRVDPIYLKSGVDDEKKTQ